MGDTPSLGFFTSEALVEPRVALVADVSPRVRTKLAYGRYHAPPQPTELSAVFGNPSLDGRRAPTITVAGALYRLFDTLTADVTGFYTTSTDLAARSPSPSPLLAQALVLSGSGRSYGVQLLVRKELSHGLFGWVSYTLSRAERQDTPGGPVRLFDYDQTHVLTALASWAIGKGFEVGSRFRFADRLSPHAGHGRLLRRAAPTPTSRSSACRTSIRILPFVSLDLARLQALRARQDRAGGFYLDVQNVTNRQNPAPGGDRVHCRTTSSRAYITGLPILPSLGLRFAW